MAKTNRHRRLEQRRRFSLLLAMACGVFGGGALAAHAQTSPAHAVAITVHADRPGAAVNEDLIGFDYHAGGQPLSAVAPLHPHFVRIDAALEQVSPSPGVLRLAPLLSRLAEIRSNGAEPLVILDYMPAWLAQPAPGTDPTRAPPRDLGAWRELIKRVVAALATAPAPARWFEAWNEPDLPTYWTGTPAAWLDTAAASAHGVADAAAATRQRLSFGGPASFYPDASQIAGFVRRLRSENVPPAFVSWHYYANYPCLGPDAPENPMDPSSVALQRSLGCVNPSASPSIYSTGIATVRAAVASASDGAAAPPLILDEWNLSAGGLDARMTSNVGAAFDAATLTTFQGDGLSAAAFYQAVDTDPRPGGWGTVALDGIRRPAWFALRMWRDLSPLTLAVDGSDPSSGFWALASRDRAGTRLTTLLSSFSASSPADRAVTLTVVGLPRAGSNLHATVQRIDAAHDGAGAPETLPMAGSRLSLMLPAQAVALVTLSSPGGHAPSGASGPACRPPARLRFAIHPIRRSPIVEVDVFAGRRRIARVRGPHLRRVTVRRPTRGLPVRLRIVDHAASGATLTTTRWVRRCGTSPPRRRARH